MMKEKKSVSLPVVILNSVVALIWIVVCIKEYFANSVEWIHLLIAVVWTICASIWISGYFKSKCKK